MRLIVTDLTRFKKGSPIVCIAGISLEDQRCIRPLDYMTRAWCDYYRVAPGTMLEGRFTPSPYCKPPHVEDFDHNGTLTVVGPAKEAEFKEILRNSLTPSVEAGFGERATDDKYYTVDCAPDRSIITVSVNPDLISIEEDSFKKDSLKMHFNDGSSTSYRFRSVTDLRFSEYAFREYRNSIFTDLNDFINKQEEVYLRIGLGRAYAAPEYPEGYWLQVNGIYTFPEYIEEIRNLI